ncbi:MAG: adenylate kinase family protein [Metamycoplasmataceae bacterium]
MINKKNIIFLGAPGSGKGTVSEILIAKTNLSHISTGNIFREEIAKKSPLGLEVKQIVDSGGYVPDDITNKIVENKLNELTSQKKNFILDGYPRTLDQAIFLSKLKVDEFLIIVLEISKEQIVKRLSSRLFCPQCKGTFNSQSYKSDKCPNDQETLIRRKDDEPEAISKRFDIYEEQTFPLIDFYKKNFSNNFHVVDSSQDKDLIISDILEIIK